jgi:histidinol-phosphate aminotransferase
MTIDLASMQKKIIGNCRMIFLCNPNNPTGTTVTRDDFESFLKAIHPDVVVVVDEAYGEFIRDEGCPRGIDYLNSGRAVVTLRTFSKAYGLAGLRIGYGCMHPETAAVLHQVRPPFNVNIPAQVAATAALDDKVFLESTRKLIREGLDYLTGALDRLGMRHFPTQANFFLIDVGMSADDIYEQLLRQGVITRSMSAYGFSRFIRVNIGLPEENEQLIRALEKIRSGG